MLIKWNVSKSYLSNSNLTFVEYVHSNNWKSVNNIVIFRILSILNISLIKFNCSKFFNVQAWAIDCGYNSIWNWFCLFEIETVTGLSLSLCSISQLAEVVNRFFTTFQIRQVVKQELVASIVVTNSWQITIERLTLKTNFLWAWPIDKTS
jgi:hypothetical protein